MSRVEPNRNVYIGHRYVPLVVGEWDKSIQYEGLSIVTYKGGSYTSKKRTPSGIDIENDEYWVLTGNYNAQIEYYRDDVNNYRDEVAGYKENTDNKITTLNDDFNNYKESLTGDFNNYKENINTILNTQEEKNENYVDDKINDISINVKDFGALGDGLNDDTESIQNALDSVSFTGGKIYIPQGTYKLSNALEIYSNTELYGSGMYNTILKPVYKSDNSNRDVIVAYGNVNDRLENIVLHDFRVSGNDRIEKNSFVYTDIFSRIYLRCIDNLNIYNISSYAVSQTIFMHGCENIIVENINANYSNTAVSINNDLFGDNKMGILNKIIGNDVSTVIDFGGGGIDFNVTNILGHHDKFPFVQEGIDIGGSKNININNVIFRDFHSGLMIKGESGKEWDDITINNAKLYGFEETGINAIHGSETGAGKLTINNSYLKSDKMTNLDNVNYSAMNIRENISECYIYNTVIDVNGNAFNGNKYGILDIDNLKIDSGGHGIFINNTAGETEKVKLNNLKIKCKTDPIRILSSVDGFILNDFEIYESDAEGIYINNCKNPEIKNGTINNTVSHGISIRTTDDIISKDNVANIKIINVDVKNWGIGDNENSAGITFLKNLTSVSDVKNIKIINTDFLLDDSNVKNQIGINWTNLQGVDYTVLDNVTFVDTPRPNAGPRGVNGIENILEI